MQDKNRCKTKTVRLSLDRYKITATILPGRQKNSRPIKGDDPAGKNDYGNLCEIYIHIMLFKILNVLGRRIPIGDHIGNTVQAAQMGKCPFVEFGFIKQHVNIFHILKEIIIQWKLCPVGDGVTVFQVSTVNREKQLVKIQ